MTTYQSVSTTTVKVKSITGSNTVEASASASASATGYTASQAESGSKELSLNSAVELANQLVSTPDENNVITETYTDSVITIIENTNIICSDLDGTIIKGDITEGSSYFPGIVEYLYSIGKVNSLIFPTFDIYQAEYFRRIDRYDTGGFCQPYDIYDKSQDPYIAEYWETTIQNYFVPYTKNYLDEKAKNGYKVWVVSASPSVFIEPIKNYMNIDKILAVAPASSSQVITYAAGKVDIVKENTDNLMTNVSGYIGDSWNNDGAIMSFLKNIRPTSDVQYINHGQMSYDTNDNLLKYNILKVDAY
jgi:hypothetical protein